LQVAVAAELIPHQAPLQALLQVETLHHLDLTYQLQAVAVAREITLDLLHQAQTVREL
jgi:hypothetical protein